ncbi:MAG: hypothetical protein KDB21_01505 [Acidimicrobiales bacterium]|nr:hypothetical protein [Acidimicrobiales bacterium]
MTWLVLVAPVALVGGALVVGHQVARLSGSLAQLAGLVANLAGDTARPIPDDGGAVIQPPDAPR